MNIRTLKTALGALAAVAATGYAMSATAAVDMKIGFASVNDPQQAVANEAAKRINASKEMGINVRTFPGGQIGTSARMIEGLQFGTLEAMLVPPGFMIGINKAFEVLDAPGLFKDPAHAQRTINDPEFYGRYSKLAESKGIKMAAMFVYGPTSWATKKPIRTLADFRGMKIRVLATKIESELASAVGAAGVPMPFPQVLAAIQRGTIDGCRSSIIVMGGAKFFTTTRYITVVESGMIPDAILVSTAWLEKLSGKQREFVETTLSGLTDWAYKTSLDYGRKAEKRWKDNGAEIIRLSDADQKAFMARVKPLGDKVLGSDPKTNEMYALLKKAAARQAPR